MIADTRDQSLGNKRIPALAPPPVGYVATVELERAAITRCELSLEHQSKGDALFKKNDLKNALQEFQLSLTNWKKTLGHYRNLEEHYRFNATLLRTQRHPLQDKEQEKHQTVQNDLRLTQLSVSSCHSKIGCILYKQGDLREALSNFRTAASLCEDLGEPTTGSSAEYLHSMIRSISKELQREQLQDSLLRAASLRIQAGCALYEQGRLVLAMKEFKQAADLCRQQPDSQEAVRMLFMIGSFCIDKKEELVQYLLKFEGQASDDWPASSDKTSPWLLEEKKATLQESVMTKQKLPQVSAPTHGNSALKTLAEAATICQESPAAIGQESKGRRPFNEHTERPLKKRLKTTTNLDISKFKCSAGLLAAFKWEQERLAKEEKALDGRRMSARDSHHG